MLGNTGFLRVVMTAVLLVAGASSHAATTDDDLVLLDRATWGMNETGLQALRSMGREAWIDHQLHPTPSDALPTAAQTQIDAMMISQHPMNTLVIDLQTRNRAANAMTDPAEKQVAQTEYQKAMSDLARQTAARSLLRDLYAPSQLRERLTWFWFNHFNVHQYKSDIRPMLADYEEHAIRDHALGRFRDLLGATARHPAMLRYLDNAENAAGHLNENYAREIMELHTIGVGDGVYTQQDVQELARILTGFTIDPKPETPKLKPELQSQLVRDGLFEFNPNRHDYGDKLFLGHSVNGSGLGELDQALDIISRHPSTARHISTQLATYFLGTPPPDALVQSMAATFTRTDGDIAAVMAVLLHAKAFTAPVKDRFKDPVHYVLSAVRLAYDGRVIANTQPMQNWVNRMAEGLYNKETPDGFPMNAAAWTGPGQLAVRFEIARQIGSGSAGLFKPAGAEADQPAFPQLQSALYFASLRQSLGASTRAALDQANSPQDWNTLYLSSPEFMN